MRFKVSSFETVKIRAKISGEKNQKTSSVCNQAKEKRKRTHQKQKGMSL
jgi:hypothetical protein